MTGVDSSYLNLSSAPESARGSGYLLASTLKGTIRCVSVVVVVVDIVTIKIGLKGEFQD
jgi:hypothetical protein